MNGQAAGGITDDGGSPSGSSTGAGAEAAGPDAAGGPDAGSGAEAGSGQAGTGPEVGSGPEAGTGRAAIVRAARRAFAFRPYAEVTLRGIAAEAGVSASLIVKHFSTKERLFNTVADFGPAADLLFAAPPESLGRHLVLTVVRSRREQQADPLLRVVFALGNDDERVLLRERFGEQITRRLAALLPGRERALRAELVVGQLLGLGATLSLHREGANARATPEQLAALYGPSLQRLIDGSSGSSD
ncbi:TetR family transcriptional regulator [Streptomyces sp. GMY02]|uniref:TetR/AcrR family transcriptional regulator n=1 Tax=Streptomyces sp. GMY02 TaxID=1333528 RepID=UPI001C2BA927|nr:TetR family transcriptional regulator [Streptomyces sp. GMY02]QXE38382.1 TetR family transcriptional regulator [Streptomyces sp. GMY02]